LGVLARFAGDSGGPWPARYAPPVPTNWSSRHRRQPSGRNHSGGAGAARPLEAVTIPFTVGRAALQRGGDAALLAARWAPTKVKPQISAAVPIPDLVDARGPQFGCQLHRCGDRVPRRPQPPRGHGLGCVCARGGQKNTASMPWPWGRQVVALRVPATGCSLRMEWRWHPGRLTEPGGSPARVVASAVSVRR